MDYFAMDGHGVYIWISYAIVTVTMVGLYISSYLSAKARAKEVEELQNMIGERRPRRRRKQQ